MRRIPQRSLFILTLGIFLTLSSVAYANGGLPFTVLVYPTLWLLFIPIVLIEFLIHKHVLKLSAKRAFSLTLKANIFSTLWGIPITLLILPIDITFMVLAISSGSDSSYSAPVAVLAMYIIFFFFTIWYERRYFLKHLSDITPDLITRSIIIGHIASYGVMIGSIISFFIFTN